MAINTTETWQVTIPFLQADAASTPNTRAKSNEAKLDDYYQAMLVTLASMKRFNPKVELTVASNRPLPGRYQEAYASIDVVTQLVPFTRQPPENIPRTFMASLYYLDVLRHLRSTYNILLDPDVLCVDRLQFIPGFPSQCPGALTLSYEPDRRVNGLSRRQASKVHSELGLSPGMPDYYGGEIYVLPRDLLPEIEHYAELAWQYTLNAGQSNEPCFYTEEHIMNFVLAHFSVVNLRSSVRRIWTTHRHRTVTGFEGELSLWHLPAEKGRGFRAMYAPAVRSSSWFWQADRSDFVRRSAATMGLAHRPASRWIPDQLGAATNMLLGPKQ